MVTQLITRESSRDLVSVIVPVYNASEYLCECVDSLLSQDYHDIEIVLVDDGSIDASSDLCDQYAALDHRVRTIHKSNGGQSSARNAGMKVAKGRWVAFIDVDDVVSKRYIGCLVEAAAKTQADFVCCRYQVFSGMLPDDSDKKVTRLIVVDGPTGACEVLSEKRASTGPWCKLVDKELWNSFPFPEGRKFEDLVVVWKVAEAATKVCLVDAVLYYYRKHTGSTTAISSISLASASNYRQSIEQVLREAERSPNANMLRAPAMFRAALECCRLYEMCASDSSGRRAQLGEHASWAIRCARHCCLLALLNKRAPLSQRLRILLFTISPNLAVVLRRRLSGSGPV